MPLNIDFQQILLHLFNFVILFGGLYFILYSPVKKFMEKRQSEYQASEDKTKENLAASEKSKAEYESKVAAFEAEKLEKDKEARKQADAAADKLLKKAQEEAEGIVAKAKEDGEHEKARIIADAQGDIADIVNEAAQKLAVNAPASEAYDRFLDSAEESIPYGTGSADASLSPSEAEAGKLIREAQEEAADIVSKAKEDGAREKAKIIADAQGDIVDIVSEVAQKLAAKAPTSKAYDRFLDSAERGSQDE